MDWNVVDAHIAPHALLAHPFYLAWSAGQLTIQDLQFYAGQYYALETMFPRLISRIHSNCADPAIRQSLLSNLMDEESGDLNHRELWLQFAEGLGCDREAVMHAELRPETQTCLETLQNLAADSDPAIGLSMLYAYESQLPAISQSKIDGLKRFYGVEDPRTLQFFEVHKAVDVWHSEQEQAAIEALGTEQPTVNQAAQSTAVALWQFLDGVDAATRLARSDTACMASC